MRGSCLGIMECARRPPGASLPCPWFSVWILHGFLSAGIISCIPRLPATLLHTHVAFLQASSFLLSAAQDALGRMFSQDRSTEARKQREYTDEADAVDEEGQRMLLREGDEADCRLRSKTLAWYLLLSVLIAGMAARHMVH